MYNKAVRAMAHSRKGVVRNKNDAHGPPKKQRELKVRNQKNRKKAANNTYIKKLIKKLTNKLINTLVNKLTKTLIIKIYSILISYLNLKP
ncbi:MAG: hypothetical protein NTX59_08620 [Elusimicrobia bacterium]|nr:hypothetical protein [Elusimicrobiota bacterium]